MIKVLLITNKVDVALTTFERRYNFTSLRNTINDKESVWLNNSNPDFDQCPQIHSIESHVERTLWNASGEVMVGGKIYKYDEFDTKFIKIEDGDFNKLALINSGNEAVFSDPNVFVEEINQNSLPNYYMCKRNDNNTFNTTNQAISLKMVCANRIKSKSWEFGKHALYASTYSYKKTGTWKRWTTTVGTGYYGNKYNGCNDTPVPLQNSVSRRHNHIVTSHKRDGSFGLKTLDMNGYSGMLSTHSIPGAPSPNNGNGLDF